MKADEQTPIYTVLHPPKVWERFVDEVYSILSFAFGKRFPSHEQYSSKL